MESIKSSEIKRLSLFLQQGTQAYVYHDKKNAYKLYKYNYKMEIIFNLMDIEYQLERLSRINLNSYVTPKFKITDKRGFLAGYGMDYIKAKTVNRLSLRVNTSIFIDDLKRLEEDTYKISEEKYILRDKSVKNVLYNEELGFKLIDLDNGIFLDEKTSDDIYRDNIKFIKDIIKGSIYGVSPDDKIATYDKELAKCLYNNESLTDFIEYLESGSKREKTLIKDIIKRRSDLIITKDYYGH